eukprot:TRINITY_DN5083_c0_g1_i2.p1 TRINITY_DN5083_c0_g1~~TRINITY_DN5083_c0_g1_i2.p1  ORF type:complete len:764 (+),score=191.92 TRINITY_DN5083_c0_g1_i2:34-2325(+)
MQNQNPQSLPQNLHGVLKQLQKFHEQKQYKRALKAADSILRQCPNHGETLAFKALVHNEMNQKKDAMSCIRKALKNDITNQKCWQIQAMIYRSDRNYLDAAKCYENSLLHMPKESSAHAMRDLALMHVQNRNYDAYLKVCYRNLMEKSTTKSNWISYAMATHFCGDLEKAIFILDEYDKVERSDKERYERSELLMYKADILEQTGDYARALKHMDEVASAVVDKEEFKYKRGILLLKLGQFEQAEEQFKKLIKGNFDNWNYHSALLKAIQLIPVDKDVKLKQSITLEADKCEKLLKFYDEWAEKNPLNKGTANQITLSFVGGEEFKKRFSKFFCNGLTKGLPALFRLVKYLYRDGSKLPLIQDVVLNVEKSLVETGKLPGEELLETPTSTLWLYFYLSQHYNFLKQTEKAFEYADKCSKHTPTVLDIEILRAWIYRDSGDFVNASKHMEEARTLDLADRYLNTKSTLYLLRADNIPQAQATIAMFTKPDPEDKNPDRNPIYDMQVSWYEQEEGESWLRQKQYGKALRKFTNIVKHFEDFYNDQLDFHSYCTRKMTLRAYMRMMTWQDNIQSHKYFFKAASSIVKCYLELIDNPPVSAEKDEFAGLSEEEKKKALKKKKKEEAKKRAEEEAKKATAGPQKGKKSSKEEDPDGEKLLSLDYLSEANRYLQYLLQFSSNKIETQLLAFKVAWKNKKYLLALKAINKGLAIEPHNHELHLATVQLLSHGSSTLAPLGKQAFDSEAAKLLNGKTLSQFKEDFKGVVPS